MFDVIPLDERTCRSSGNQKLGSDVGENGVRLDGWMDGMGEQEGMIRTFGTDSLDLCLKLFGSCLKEWDR